MSLFGRGPYATNSGEIREFKCYAPDFQGEEQAVTIPNQFGAYAAAEDYAEFLFEHGWDFESLRVLVAIPGQPSRGFWVEVNYVPTFAARTAK